MLFLRTFIIFVFSIVPIKKIRNLKKIITFYDVSMCPKWEFSSFNYLLVIKSITLVLSSWNVFKKMFKLLQGGSVIARGEEARRGS